MEYTLVITVNELLLLFIVYKLKKNKNIISYLLIYRYPIALAFKIVGRSRSVDLAKELGLLYTNFINSLNLKLELKTKLIKDLHNNWICDEWILSFIDAGRILEGITHIMTTNNYTERLNRTIESQYSGTKTVNSNFEAGLATIPYLICKQLNIYIYLFIHL